jgi:hypothetical protein
MDTSAFNEKLMTAAFAAALFMLAFLTVSQLLR